MTIKSGYVALVGRPNVGKSTLLNAVLQQKVSIVTDKPETTRTNVRGVYNCPDGQIVFLDTPGLTIPHEKLSRQMVQQAHGAAVDADIVLWLVDATKLKKKDPTTEEWLKQCGRPVFMVINKVDAITKPALWDYLNSLDTSWVSEIIPVSALKKTNLTELLNTIIAHLPEGPAFYQPDQTTDIPVEFMLSEIVREKIMQNTQHEVPHAVAVAIDELVMEEKLAHVSVTVLCEKESQKGILIGKGGLMLKKIATAARKEMAEYLNRKVFLQVFVRVEPDWRNRKTALAQAGYNTDGSDNG